MSMYYVYMLECSDHTFYIGVSNDVPRRVKAHNSGKGAKYTRGRTPVRLIYQERCADKSVALKREIEIKKWPRSKKKGLIK